MMKRKSGFSLIELMSVVAIIGILATIAVPKYNHYRLKAMRVEGLTKASTLAGAMSTFWVQYGVYASCFGAMGVEFPAGYYGIATSGFFSDSAPRRNAIARGRGALCPDSVSGALVSGMDALPATKWAAGCPAPTAGWVELNASAITDNPLILLSGFLRAGCQEEWVGVHLIDYGNATSHLVSFGPEEWKGALQGPVSD